IAGSGHVVSDDDGDGGGGWEAEADAGEGGLAVDGERANTGGKYRTGITTGQSGGVAGHVAVNVTIDIDVADGEAEGLVRGHGRWQRRVGVELKARGNDAEGE